MTSQVMASHDLDMSTRRNPRCFGSVAIFLTPDDLGRTVPREPNPTQP